MKYLKKTWIRVILSLIGGGFISEVIHISTGDPNRQRADNNLLIYFGSALIIYLMLTNLSKKAN
jgi:hypothetical protein